MPRKAGPDLTQGRRGPRVPQHCWEPLGAAGSHWELLGSVWDAGCRLPRAKTSLLQREGDALSPAAGASWCCESPARLWRPALAPGCLQLDPASSSASAEPCVVALPARAARYLKPLGSRLLCQQIVPIALLKIRPVIQAYFLHSFTSRACACAHRFWEDFPATSTKKEL